MRRFLAATLLLIALAGCTVWKDPKHSTWSSASGAEQCERLMWRAFMEKDWTEAEHHLAPAFVGVDPQGRHFDRAGWIERWKAAQIRDLSLGEVSVQPEGADMVVTYELHLEASDAGHDIAPKALRVISVWQQLKRGWIMISQSSTPII